jgi:hypothetical protein
MMQKYVPLEKQSKRQKQEYYAARRKDWGGLNPVTRKPPNPKAYIRKKSGQRYEHEPRPGFFWNTREKVIRLMLLLTVPAPAFQKLRYMSAYRLSARIS